tara:strand:+ start:2545 stop:3222 length:678 start_codon:yes stop_codon:yes gene_type:complete
MSKNKTYLNFEDLPVYNFYKIVESSDMRWFYTKFRTDKDIEVSEKDIIDLSNRYKNIYDERVKYTNDTKSIEYYRKLNQLSDLETKLFRITSAFDVLIELKVGSNLFFEYIVYFKEDEGFSYSKEIKSDEQALEYVEWLRREIKGFKTKVAVVKSNYSDVLKPVDINYKNANFDIVKEKILLQESLLISIDIYKCPLIEWCAMIMRAEEKAIQAKRELDKIKNKR